jgi:hypothetical protein
VKGFMHHAGLLHHGENTSFVAASPRWKPRQRWNAPINRGPWSRACPLLYSHLSQLLHNPHHSPILASVVSCRQ